MKAILPVFTDDSVSPYYLQLYDYLKSAILAGDIEEGERLPSLRNLAQSTGLSITTIENAYNQLLVEGYINSRPYSGYYANNVSAGPGKSVRSSSKGNETLPLSERTVPLKNVNSDKKLSAAGCDDAPDASPTPMRYDPDCFDFNKWKKCMNRVLSEHSPSLFFEGSPQGEPALRREISRYLYESRGVSCHPDQIFIGAGTQQITGHLAGILRDLDIGHVALETPGYEPVRNTFRDRGFAITDVAVDDKGILLDHLPVNIRAAAYVSPSNNSFAGSVMPIGRRYEMLRWAISNDSYIIEDDYDSELRYFGRPIPPIRSLADDDRVIYLGSFSSTLFAAIRMSYMILPPAIAESFSKRLPGYSQTCSKLEQLTLANFMETGLYRTHIRKLRKIYAQKMALVTDILRKDAADFVEIKNNSSGLCFLLRANRRDLKKLIEDAESLGIPATISDDLILLYYNQVPLQEVPEVFGELILRWREA